MITGMKNLRKLLAIFSVALMLVIGLGSCKRKTKTVDPEKKATLEKINYAKSFLSDGNYDIAYEKFKELVVQNDNNGPKYYKAEAFYGYALSDMLYTINKLVEQLQNTLTMIGGLLNTGKAQISSPIYEKRLISQALKEFEPQQAGGLNTIVRGFLYNNLINPIERWKDALSKVEKIGHLDFKISPFPIEIANIRIMDLSGEHDMGEVFFLQGVYNILLGWLHFFCSVDFNMNIMDKNLMNFLFKYFMPRITDKNSKKIPLLLNAFTLILNDNPGFLGLNGNVGVKESQTARVDFQTAYAEFANAIAEIESEKDNQSDDIIQYYVDDNGNQYAVFNIHDLNFSTGSLGSVPGGQVPDVTISTKGKLMLNIGNGMESRLRKLSDNFKPGGPAISWAEDIAPIVSALSVMIIKSGMLTSIIESALGQMGDQYSDLKQMINSVLGSDLIDENMITGLLTGFIPDFIAFKFGDFYNSPPNYRDLFPAWTYGITTKIQDNGHPVTIPTDYFLFEYECADPSKPITDVTGQLGPLMIDSFVCNDPYKKALSDRGSSLTGDIVDQAHFTQDGWVYQQFTGNGVIDKIEPLSSNGLTYQGFTEDGYKGLLPYMYFPDPSINHLLMIKLKPLLGGDVDSSKLQECSDMMDNYAEPSGVAGNKCLNFALNKVFSQILSTLNLANSLVISAK